MCFSRLTVVCLQGEWNDGRQEPEEHEEAEGPEEGRQERGTRREEEIALAVTARLPRTPAMRSAGLARSQALGAYCAP